MQYIIYIFYYDIEYDIERIKIFYMYIFIIE